MRPALMSIGDTAHAAKDSFGDIDVGHFGAPGGWPVQRFSPQSSLRHVCPTIVIIGHTESAKNRGGDKNAYCTNQPLSRKSTSWLNRPAAPLARPTCRDPPTRGGGAEHPAARKHRALAPIRAPAARREMAGRGMETTDSQRLTVTPASPAASDALPGTPLPHAQKRARWALAGFLGTGSSASSRKARALWLHRSRQALHGPARLAGEAAARTAALGAVPGTVPDRPPWPQPLRIES